MTKTELLEVWGFLDILKSQYIKRLRQDSYSFDEIKSIDEKHYKRIVELQHIITEETESF